MLRNLSIRMQLFFGFGLISVILLAVAAVGTWGIGDMLARADDALAHDAFIGEHAARARANTAGLRRYEKDIFLEIADRSSRADYVSKWEDQGKRLRARIDSLKGAVVLPEDAAAVADISAKLESYTAGFRTILSQVEAGALTDPAQANTAMEKYKDFARDLDKEVQALSYRAEERSAKLRPALTETGTTSFARTSQTDGSPVGSP